MSGSDPYAVGGLIGGTVTVVLAVGARIWSQDGTVHEVTAGGRLERRPDEEPNPLARLIRIRAGERADLERCGILTDHEPHPWQLLVDDHAAVPRGEQDRRCDGSAWRRP